MNKIFKVKRNSHGISVACSETAKSTTKNSRRVLGAVPAAIASVLFMTSAQAELINGSTNPFQATIETGETTSGYNALTSNPNTVANGFATFAISQGSITIGAESGASGDGLSREESVALATGPNKAAELEKEIANIQIPAWQTPAQTSVQRNTTDFSLLNPDTLQLEKVSSLEQYNKTVSATKALLDGVATVRQVAKQEEARMSPGDTQAQDIVQNKAAWTTIANSVIDNIATHKIHTLTDDFKPVVDGAKTLLGLLSQVTNEESVTPEHIKSYEEQTGILQGLDSKLEQNVVENDLYNAVFKPVVSGIGTLTTSSAVLDVAKGYSPNGDTDKKKLAAVVAEMNNLKEAQAASPYDNIPKEITDLLEKNKGNVDISGITIAPGSDRDTPWLESDQQKYFAAVLKFMKDNQITDEFQAVSATIAERTYNKSGASGLTGEYINLFEKAASKYIDDNKAAEEKLAKLQAERDSILKGLEGIAKKYGIENPTSEQLQEILKNLSPNAIAIGRKAFTSGDSAVGIGANSVVTGNHSVSLGDNNAIAADKVVALGANITVIDKAPQGSVIIGDSSEVGTPAPVSNITLQGKSHQFSGTNPTSAVSIGSAGKERQIQHVAAGRISSGSTDAINGSQLYAVTETLANLKNKTTSVSTKNTNLTVTPSVNGDNTDYDIALKPTLTGINAIGGNGSNLTFNNGDINAGGAKVTNIGTPTNNTDAANKQYVDAAIAGVPKTTVVGKDGVITTKNGDTVVVGLDPATLNKLNREESVVAGNNIIVTQAKTNTTGGKEFIVATSNTLTGINTISNGPTTIKLDGAKPAVDMGGAVIKNVGTPVDANDAITKKYLDDRIDGVTGKITVTTVSAKDDNIVVTKNGHDYQVGLSDEVKSSLIQVAKNTDGIAANKVELNTLKPKVEKNTADIATNKANIAANKAEIDNLKPKVAKNTADIATNKADILANKAEIDKIKPQVAKNADDIATNAAMIKKGINIATEDGVTTNHQLGNTITISGKGGVYTTTNNQGHVTVNLGKDLDLNSIKVGGATLNQDGINAGGKVISGVRAGTIGPNSTDAVNGNQLYNLYQYVNQNQDGLKDRINEVEDNMEAGMAGARAVAALPQVRNLGKSMVAVGLGQYRDKSAAAIGFSRLSDNGKTTFKFNVDGNTEKQFGVGVGLGYEW